MVNINSLLNDYHKLLNETENMYRNISHTESLVFTRLIVYHIVLLVNAQCYSDIIITHLK